MKSTYNNNDNIFGHTYLLHGDIATSSLLVIAETN